MNNSEANDRFGAVLVAGELDGRDGDDLVVGVPVEDWAGDVDQGMIHLLFGGPSGLVVTYPGQWRIQDGFASGPGLADDLFGAALAHRRLQRRRHGRSRGGRAGPHDGRPGRRRRRPALPRRDLRRRLRARHDRSLVLVPTLSRRRARRRRRARGSARCPSPPRAPRRRRDRKRAGSRRLVPPRRRRRAEREAGGAREVEAREHAGASFGRAPAGGERERRREDHRRERPQERRAAAGAPRSRRGRARRRRAA